MSSGEFTDVSTEMLWAHAVISAIEPAFEHRPEALHSVCVSLPSDIFPKAMLDRISIQSLVSSAVIGVELRSGNGYGTNELADRCFIDREGDLGGNLFGLAVFDSDDRSLANRPSSCFQLLD